MPEAIPQTSALDEETARAEVYGLLARLYYAPPDAALLANLRMAVTEAPAAGAFLEEPWRAFIGVARDMQEGEIEREFESLFGGVGKPDVLPYASSHLSGFLNERPLAQLRDDLLELGLTRDETMNETEDHVAYLFEVMRFLIAGDDVAVANLTRQREFFARHLQPWIGTLCDEIGAHPGARFYAALAAFTHAFISVEQQGFDLLD